VDEEAAVDVANRRSNMTSTSSKLSRATTGLAFAGVLALIACPVLAQKTYPSPAAAADALVDGIARHDTEAVKASLGNDYRKLLPVEGIDSEDVTGFLEAWAQRHRIVQQTPDRALLEVGTNGWTLPIPIVKRGSGWVFDTVAGRDEIRARRIGRNELAAILVSLAYTDAQEEYFARDRDGDGVPEFATRGLSTPGKRDGLYWPARSGEASSPLGPLFAHATPGQPFHGYVYKILSAQGKDAKGGAKSYLRNGQMTEGYALVAWPAKYGETGVMTFIVNRDGVVHQKDLGPDTATAARAIAAYNPDASWQRVGK
jgi:hypothetical protein